MVPCIQFLQRKEPPGIDRPPHGTNPREGRGRDEGLNRHPKSTTRPIENCLPYRRRFRYRCASGAGSTSSTLGGRPFSRAAVRGRTKIFSSTRRPRTARSLLRGFIRGIVGQRPSSTTGYFPLSWCPRNNRAGLRGVTFAVGPAASRRSCDDLRRWPHEPALHVQV